MKFYSNTPGSVISYFESRLTGLSGSEAVKRSAEFGKNELPEKLTDSILIIFLRQFQSPLIYILGLAAAFIFLIGERIDALVILIVLVFNAVIGAFQEGKAQNTLAALRKFVQTNATVLRDGVEMVIKDTEAIPGDILILQEGEKVAADSRIISSNNLQVDEAALTGESTPSEKIPDVLIGEDLPTAEQKNMVFKGTYVVSGNARAIVVATGSQTVIGKIASEMTGIEAEIPLKANIRYLSRLIIWIAVVVSGILFFTGILLGHSAKQMFVSVVALSVSIIPEGLPIAITLVLATGVWRMSKKNALVKKLQAVEALGQARIIAVDKTGTITKNELMVEEIYSAGKMYRVEGVGYDPSGKIWFENGPANIRDGELYSAVKVAAYCASGRPFLKEENGMWGIIGDPTEVSLFVLAQKAGLSKDILELSNPLLGEVPFNYKSKHHLTLHKENEMKILTAVGAPEAIIDLCQKVARDGEELVLDEGERSKIENKFLELSARGMRVLAFATKTSKTISLSKHPANLVFGGFFGMRDTIRPEAITAVKRAMRAGIRIVMITGDHKFTATAIAKETGIWKKGDTVLTGAEIENMSDEEFAEKLSRASVFARVTPEHKLKIINGFRERGEIIAMTGDGVNDALSLVAADLGVAMGKIGTEVAKEAADIVLLDDDFGNIISAVEEGRSIYKTVKKVILYLFSTSLGEVLAISIALFAGLPLPILPSQIIWLNFITDGFLTIALAMEPKEEGLLRGSFEKPKKYLMDKLMVERMFLMALPMALGSVFLFQRYLEVDIAKALTMSLTALAVFQWFNAWNSRHEYKSIFSTNPFSNMPLIYATLVVVLLQLFAVYNPFMQNVLHTTALNLNDWLLVVGVALSIVLVEETRKIFSRKV